RIDYLDLRGVSDEWSWNHLLTKPIETVYEHGYAESMILLIDSLDEAVSSEDSLGVPHLLGRLGDVPEQVRIIVTSRPDPRVLLPLRGSRRYDVIEDAIDALTGDDAGTQDIYQYALRRLDHFEDKPRRSIADRISKAADRNFLYAQLVLDDLLSPGRSAADFDDLRLP